VIRVLAVTSCGDFFLQGEPQERAYRESLTEACGVLGRVGEKRLETFFYRESRAEITERAAR